MGVPEVKTCCCGCTLETGTLIIGWLNIVFAALTIIGSIMGIISPNSQNHGSTASLVLGMIAGVITLLVSIMLIIGVKRRLPKYVHYWILIATISFVISLLNGIIQGIMLSVNGNVGGGVGAIIVVLISGAIMAYLIIVVFNFKRELLSENQHV
ncbi:uncharacterized protein LOC143921433 [Arctopsyche grandis]|uniref:uncharacterized protein LOC143921433 n=1 Tax=Arctopsyche grandis TaxID=121162 RepID=UPI00406D8836